ncbi:MAG: hypothetical protein XD78_1033 [Desulfotomaculum sp. 46_296]|nr:MAG: hypothetical protein XD78_1033 [Desulfotomaculum sp. 46_296]KUK84552.1 MAG: hypothetical protein XE00_0657 [Desulfofundulus kuznetsovii]HAG08464.1 hypothetical protein [Desulfotomaculum sp.]HAU31717.1 hypothetical protein [Desulfotomaculum sp.]
MAPINKSRKRYRLRNNISYYITKNLRLTQLEFAERIGMHPTYLNRIIKNKVSVSGLSLRVICEALGEPERNVFPLYNEVTGMKITSPAEFRDQDPDQNPWEYYIDNWLSK